MWLQDLDGPWAAQEYQCTPARVAWEQQLVPVDTFVKTLHSARVGLITRAGSAWGRDSPDVPRPATNERTHISGSDCSNAFLQATEKTQVLNAHRGMRGRS